VVAESLVRALTAALALATVFSACERTVDRLPALPAFTHENAISIARFRAADVRARKDPSAENVGRLGMLYHAYQFQPEA